MIALALLVTIAAFGALAVAIVREVGHDAASRLDAILGTRGANERRAA
jgi:hypothetical protein